MAILNSRNTRYLARGLGWFSIGLGLAEALSPRASARCAGVAMDERLVRLLGLRELVTGIGLVTRRKPQPWLWARVAGDALDLSLLGVALAGSLRGNRQGNAVRAGVVTAAVAGITALDILCGERTRRESAETLHVDESLSLKCSPNDAYRYWRDFENLPRYMDYLQSVRVIDDTRSHWIARGPGGLTIEWESELSTDLPGELLSWHSIEGSDVIHTGSVRFAPASGGSHCKVNVHLRFSRPVGKSHLSIGKLVGKSIEHQIHKDLRRFKEAIETGEAARQNGALVESHQS